MTESVNTRAKNANERICAHLWVHRAGSEYRANPVEFCAKCDIKKPPCDHYGIDLGGTDYYGTSNPPQESDWNFAYCPKCGEKL